VIDGRAGGTTTRDAMTHRLDYALSLIAGERASRRTGRLADLEADARVLGWSTAGVNGCGVRHICNRR
jgi:hypothetical protein